MRMIMKINQMHYNNILVDENNKGKNLVGGLVIKDNGKFYYYDRGVYKTYEEEPSKWKNFSELLK